MSTEKRIETIVIERGSEECWCVVARRANGRQHLIEPFNECKPCPHGSIARNELTAADIPADLAAEALGGLIEEDLLEACLALQTEATTVPGLESAERLGNAARRVREAREKRGAE